MRKRLGKVVSVALLELGRIRETGVIDKEEGLVAAVVDLRNPDRSAEGAAEFILLERRLLLVQIV